MKKRIKKDLSRSNKISIIPKLNRSQGHVEFMISFILFISAILLLFVFINPIGNSESKLKIQENAKDIIIENISAVVGKLSVISDFNPTPAPAGKSCYGSLIDQYQKTGENITETDTTPSPNPNPEKKLYLLYYSEFINHNLSHYEKHACNSNKYSIGPYIEEKVIIKNKTMELKKSYELDYKTTKKELGMSNDFTFTFKYKNGSIVSEMSVQKETSKNVEKFASEFPVRVIDDKANINEMIININLW